MEKWRKEREEKKEFERKIKRRGKKKRAELFVYAGFPALKNTA